MEVEVLNSWIINEQGIIVELKNNGIGIPQGARLCSEQKNLEWKVKGRLIFDHTDGKQVKFQNETEIPIHFTYSPHENKAESRKAIYENESKGIYQYWVEPENHNNKPAQFEKLRIIL